MQHSITRPKWRNPFDDPFLAVYDNDSEQSADLRRLFGHFDLVIIPLDRKGPRDKGWPQRVYTEAELLLSLQRANHYGIKLKGDYLDLDGDGPDAERWRAELFAGTQKPPTPTWRSPRGTHEIYKCPPELAALDRSKFYFGDKGQLEVRTGAGGILQTVLPHPDNGREWIGPALSPEFSPADLPQLSVERLVAAATAKPQDDSKTKEQVNTVTAWLDENGYGWSGVSHKVGFAVINLTSCLFKGHDDGNTGILIDSETGHIGFNCFHAGCEGKSFADLEAIARVPFTGRRSMFVEPPEYLMVDFASASLRDVPGLYQRGTDLVRIVFSSGVPTIQLVVTAALQEILSRVTEWWLRTKKSVSRTYVPAVTVKLLDARTEYPVSQLDGIVASPVLRPDGSILSVPGYDVSTRLYLAAGMELPLMSIEEAKTAIDYVLVDFPFAAGADKAAFIAGLLTPLARPAFPGSSPLFLLEANVPGAGKSLAADVIGHIVSGNEMPRMTAPDGDEEWRKRITSIVLGGEQLVLIDNVATTLGSPSLDAMLTGTSWSDRILGKSETVTAPIVHTTFATANNVIVGGDLIRRVLPIRLQSPLENPEKRDDFREPDLLGYVQRNQAELLAAALTILRHYFDGGKPNLGLPAWGSYEGWSSVVRSAVVFAGYPDPVGTRERFTEQSDSNAELLRLLLQGWDDLAPGGTGLTVREAYSRRAESPALLDAIDSLPAARDEKKQLGVTLSRFRGRVVNGRSFSSALGPGKVQVWRVQ